MSQRFAVTSLVALLAAPAIVAQTINVTAPDGTQRAASGGDFATDVIGDPWDMDQATDVSAYVLDFQSYSVAGGFFTGTTTATPGRSAQIFLQYQGEVDTNHHGREGVFFPIDTSRYRTLSMRMYADRSTFMRFLYFRQPGMLTDTSASNFVQVVPGWNTYDVDLVALGGACAGGSSCSSPGWGGIVLGFSVEPSVTQPSTSIVIDWVRLRSGDTGPTTFTVRWTANDPTGAAVVDLYADTDTDPGNGLAGTIATALPASAGQAPWGVNRLDPAAFYVYAVIGTTFAGNAMGDPWDMSQASDVTWEGWQSASVSGGTFSGVAQSGAAAVFPRFPAGRTASASAYRYLRLRMDVSASTYYRAVWRRQGSAGYSATAFFTATPGMKDYVVDMGQYAEWTGAIELLRVNPVFGAGQAVTIDAIELSTMASAAPPTGSDYSDGPLLVNTPPQIQITDPDRSGGEDFAVAVVGNAWDMNEASDIQGCFNCASTTFSGGQVHFTNSNNDVGIYQVNFGPHNIDASRYHILTVGYTVDAFQVPTGSVSRVIFRDVPTNPMQSSTQDYIQYPGYNVLVTDLTTALMEPAFPAPWQGTIGELRFDTHEFPNPVASHVDFVRLAREDESNGTFNVTWTDADPDSSATIELYWDVDSVGFDGTRFAQGLSEDDPGNVFPWTTSGVPQGPVWVYARITDGVDTIQRYATGVLINTVTDGTPPFLTLLDPARSATGVSPFSPIRAHVRDAFSGVDIASVQVRVNSTLVSASITGNASDVAILYTPPSPWTFGQTVNVQIDADDLAAGSNHLTDTYSFTVTTTADSDGDGMPDQFETASDLNPFDNQGPEGAAGDPDEDGMTSLAEYQAGRDPTSWAQVVVGPGPGPTNAPLVRLLYNEGTPEATFAKTAYGVSRFGVNVGVGDVESRTSRAVLTGPGPGDVFGPQVKAFRGNNTDVAKVNFYAYGTLKFGCHAAGGDVDGDGFAEIATTPGRGAVFGPHVRGWNFDGGTLGAISKVNFFAYGTLKYGAHVAPGEMEADGFDELLTAPGPGVVFGPQVRGFDYDGASLSSISKINFLAIPGVTQYGAEVATGQLDGDAFDEILAGPGPGAGFGCVLQGWSYDGAAIAILSNLVTTPFSSLYGLCPGAGDVDGDRIDEPLAGPGPNPAGASLGACYDYDGGPLTPMPGTPFTAFSGLSYGTRVASGRMGF